MIPPRCCCFSKAGHRKHATLLDIPSAEIILLWTLSGISRGVLGTGCEEQGWLGEAQCPPPRGLSSDLVTWTRGDMCLGLGRGIPCPSLSWSFSHPCLMHPCIYSLNLWYEQLYWRLTYLYWKCTIWEVLTYVYTCGNLHFSIRGRWEEEPFLGAELVEAGSGLYTQGFQFPTPMQEELEFCEKLLQTCFSTPTDDSMDRWNPVASLPLFMGTPGLLPSPHPWSPLPKERRALLVPCPGVSACLCSAARMGAEEGAGSLGPASQALSIHPPSRVHTALPGKVLLLLRLLHCHLCHLACRVPWLGTRGTIRGSREPSREQQWADPWKNKSVAL